MCKFWVFNLINQVYRNKFYLETKHKLLGLNVSIEKGGKYPKNISYKTVRFG